MTVEIIADRKVGIRRAGKGAPMLMIHCALAHSGAFAPLMAGLKDRFLMTAFDLPGHGQTGFDPKADFHDQSFDIAVDLLKKAGQPCHLTGHSFGGTVALRIAVQRPDLISSLCLYEPVYFSMLAGVNDAAYLQEQQDSHSFSNAAMHKNWPAAAQAFLQRWSAEDFDSLSETQQAYIVKTIPMIVASTQSIVDPEKGAAIYKKLPEMEIPVLLMAGEKSPKVVHHILDAIAAQIPHAKRESLPSAAHMGPITHAAEVADLIRRALD